MLRRHRLRVHTCCTLSHHRHAKAELCYGAVCCSTTQPIAVAHECYNTHVQALTLLIPLRCGRCTCGMTSRPCCMSHYISTRMCTRMVLPRGWAHSQIHRCRNVKVMRTYTGCMSHYISRPKVHAYVCACVRALSMSVSPARMHVCMLGEIPRPKSISLRPRSLAPKSITFAGLMSR